MTENEFVMREVLLEVVKQAGITTSVLNPEKAVEEAINELAESAFDAFDTRSAGSNGMTSEARLPLRFAEIGEVLSLKDEQGDEPFERIGSF